jgi:DNA-binding transcriptional MerR regulator
MGVINFHNRMFRKSNKDSQINLFEGIPAILEGRSKKQYDDTSGWHNQFRCQIISRIDESPYKVLFSDKMGAPNVSVSLLLGMMILKHAINWNDIQLFEQCRFNLLVRSALGLFNLNDVIPAESTYYLLRRRMYEHNRQKGEDLLGITFNQVTRDQISEFNVNGKNIRMDSKLIGSNIAIYSRYEVIHQTLTLFYKSLKKEQLHVLSASDKEQLQLLMEEEPQKTVYSSTRDEVKTRMQPIGILIHKLIELFNGNSSTQFQLLQRVFEEQYKVIEDQEIELLPREEITSDTLQSPHDPDATYRNKNGQKVRGYSANVTETISDDSLDLITNIDVRPANTSDTEFVEHAIETTTQVTGQAIEKIYADGAYQSPKNDPFCEDIDMVFTGIQGPETRYQLDMQSEGLYVTDMITGEIQLATPVIKTKRSTKDKWSIKTDNGYRYFSQKQIRTSQLRTKLQQRPIEELRKRNNVEATIFHLGCTLRNSKSKYRGIYKQQMWANSRGLWINLVRIINFTQQTCQRTFQTLKNQVNYHFLRLISLTMNDLKVKIDLNMVIYVILFVFINFICF